jgi:hypothetical protein
MPTLLLRFNDSEYDWHKCLFMKMYSVLSNSMNNKSQTEKGNGNPTYDMYIWVRGEVASLEKRQEYQDLIAIPK